ncbi:hypothetical protein AK830_g988 [Neonectria ditissima]|uniref:DUF6594 domain-containing protein n=1 Tax=Neonectria ditissima TaxID=78410 RepID=A0A0P7B6R3_9HYPO|nr:hypothetical protein AK830_g988 [Neonectria ditissima]
MRLEQYILPTWRVAAPPVPAIDDAPKIEDLKPGYPRYTALISAYEPYFICRRFDKLRARVLLKKQDRLSVLEQKLDRVDNEEQSPLFLGKSRCDGNHERIALLGEIDAALADYDNFVDRTRRMLSSSNPESRNIESLQNWLNGNGCIARDERAYLAQRDLVSLAADGDSALVQLEAWIEDRLIGFYSGFCRNKSHNVSNDPNVYINSGPLVNRTAKAILLLLVTIFLLVPVVICSTITALSGRLAIVMVFTISYLLIILELTQPKTMELIIAGATYDNPILQRTSR